MSDMVSQVVPVLDEGSVYYDTNRVMKRAYRKNAPRKLRIRPPKITGELDTFDKQKERERKQAKSIHKNSSLNWNNAAKRWLVRKQQKEEIDRRIKQLDEISLRTIGTGAALGFMKAWGNKVDSGVMKLKALGTRLQAVSTDAEARKVYGDIVSVDADVDKGLQKMLWYSALLTTSSTIGLERTLIKKLKSNKQRRK